MENKNAIVAVFSDHSAAESAVKKLTAADFDMKNLSVIGKGFHTEEKVIGFYNVGDRINFWGSRGAFWGGLWGLFFGGVFITIPLIGPVILLGSLASMIIAGVEGAVIVGGMGALGAALFSLGIPKDSVIEYESAIKADGFVVMVEGTTEDVTRAKTILGSNNPTTMNVHSAIQPTELTEQVA